MKILIVTPAPPRSQKGNRITAIRWSRILKQLGNKVELTQEFNGQNSDVLIAIHARRSAGSVARFRDVNPQRPLFLALSGTDLYSDIRHNEKSLRSCKLADRLILLQPHGKRELPANMQQKSRVIYQSLAALRRKPAPLKRVFEVSVIGHLRPVKDPFRTAMAVRKLPASSKILINHMGGALTQQMKLLAEAESRRNPRYRWRGELPRWQMMRMLARSRLLVLSSKMEGGANVISESIVAGVPVISSRISGSIGLLGEKYPGYFEVGDTRALTELLHRAETVRSFYEKLTSRCRDIASLFDPERERESWQALLEEFSD